MEPTTGDEPVRAREALALRVTPRQVVIGLLFASLGFVAVAAAQGADAGGLLETAREDEVVRVLDDLAERQARLQAEQRALEAARDRLLSGSEEQRLEAAQTRADALGILAGTAPAVGPGLRIRIGDPEDQIEPILILDAVQELRDAGAEAMQLGPVRVVASTWFAPGIDGLGVSVSGTALAPPYELLVIGDPDTMATALEIPGGVADRVRTAGGTISVTPDTEVLIRALQPATPPQYARPAPSPSG